MDHLLILLLIIFDSIFYLNMFLVVTLDYLYQQAFLIIISLLQQRQLVLSFILLNLF